MTSAPKHQGTTRSKRSQGDAPVRSRAAREAAPAKTGSTTRFVDIERPAPLKMKRLPELRRTPGLSLEIQNISPRYLPVQEYVLPWLRPWLTADPHDKAVFIAKVTFRAKADHFDTSPGVKVGAIVAKDGEKIRLALREASRQIRVYPAAGAPASISGVLYFVGTLPLDLTAGGYSHVMELAATVRFDGRTIAVRRSSETETSTIAGGLFARRNSWEWWEYARESRVLNCACPLDGNLCLELLNASEDVRGLEVRRTRIAASGASPGLGLLFHQASFTESTEPASPPWDLAGRSFKRLRFSASSQEVRVARALPLIGFYDPVTATWRPWAVPLIDPSWSVAEQDLRAFCIYPNAEPISIASSSRPIAAPIRLFGDSLFGPPGAVLRIKNELPGPVRLLSVQEAHIVESDHPPGVIQGFGQRSGSARLTPNFVYGEEAPTLAAGEEMDFSLSMTFAALEQGTFATFVMVTANVDDVPGAASILVPVVYTNYLVP